MVGTKRRNDVLERDGYRCTECGTGGSRRNQLTMHHIKFRCHGGTSDMWNLTTLCQSCHRELHMEYDRLYGTPHKKRDKKKKRESRKERRNRRRGLQ